MATDFQDLKTLIKFAKDEGLTELSYNGISFRLSTAIKPAANQGAVASLSDDTEKPPTDDEFLYMSTPYYDHLRAERDAATKASS